MKSTTGNGKVRVSACLTGKANGSKFKLFIVLKEAKRQREFLHKEFKRKCSMATFTNGWMNERLTLRWCTEVLRKFSFRKRLLAWDSYEAHLPDHTRKSITNSKIETIFILGGCTKYVQARYVLWNRTFKDRIQERYDDCLVNAKHEYTAAKNIKPVPRRLVLESIIKSWE